MKTRNERSLLTLFLLLAAVATCSSLSVVPSTSKLNLRTQAGRGKVNLFQMPTSSSDQNSVEKSRRTSPLQFSMIGAAPIKFAVGGVAGVLGIIAREIKSLTIQQKTLFLGTFIVGFLLGRVRPFWKRYTDVNNIPSSLFGSNAPPLRGRAVSVSDGDTIRFLHQPTRFHPDKLKKGEKASELALPVRLCTIDTPETAKFGKPGQPFGVEAKEHLKKMLEDKVVYVRLLQKDQYSRAVAEVFTGKLPFMRKYMDVAMLEEGLAEVYTGGGAVYGPLGKDEYMEVVEKAKKAKKGIWSLDNRETAAEYKRRTKS